MNFAHKVFRKLTGFTLQKKIKNENPQSWTRIEENCFFQFPRSNQIKGLGEIFFGIFGDKTNGLVVEIGAYDGFEFSNSWGLLDRGWHGILIEPVKEFFESAKKNTMRFQNIDIYNVGLSNCTQESLIYKLGPYSSLSKNEIDIIQNSEWYQENWVLEEELIQIVEASIFFEQNVRNTIDVLIIDVEGHEYPILENLFKGRIKPKVILVEVQKNQNEEKELSHLIENMNYKRIYRDKINSIYLLQTDK